MHICAIALTNNTLITLANPANQIKVLERTSVLQMESVHKISVLCVSHTVLTGSHMTFTQTMK